MRCHVRARREAEEEDLGEGVERSGDPIGARRSSSERVLAKTKGAGTLERRRKENESTHHSIAAAPPANTASSIEFAPRPIPRPNSFRISVARSAMRCLSAALRKGIGEGAPFGPDVGGRTEVLNPVSDALLAALDPTARAAPIMHFAEDAAAPTPSPGAAAVKNALQRGIDASVRTIGIRVARKKALKAHAARAASVRDDEHVGGIGLTDIHRI